jgi:mannose/fructose/N-acetylgalactosamine-specific phosphotransferase system component IID
MESKDKQILTKKDITKSWFLWWLSAEVSNSFERLQSLAFCVCMIPILRKLYPKKEDLSAALQRHLQFFNTQAIWGGIVNGITIALEEERAKGNEVPDETIASIKAGLMGPFAGIGDTIDWATWMPIIFALFVPLAQTGSWIAAVVPVIIFAAITMFEGYSLYHIGYKAGMASATQILEAGWIKQLILGASVLGLFMMGGLSASLINVTTPLAINANGIQMSVQTDILDKLLPGLLPLLTVSGIYIYLTKAKNANYLKAVMFIFIIGITLGSLGIL